MGSANRWTAEELYWADQGTKKIQRSSLNGGGVTDLVKDIDLEHPRGIALDISAGHIYWTDAGSNKGKIFRSDLDGSDVKVLIEGKDVPNPLGIALDVSAGMMYWADAGSIKSAKLDGSDIKTISQAQSPYGVALDLQHDKIYWTNFNHGLIKRADLDGGNPETLINVDGDFRGLDLDLASGHMYWADSGENPRVLRAKLKPDHDGANIEVVCEDESLIQPRGILLDTKRGYLYLTDKGTDDGPAAIQRLRLADINQDTGGPVLEKLPINGIQNVTCLALSEQDDSQGMLGIAVVEIGEPHNFYHTAPIHGKYIYFLRFLVKTGSSEPALVSIQNKTELPIIDEIRALGYIHSQQGEDDIRGVRVVVILNEPLELIPGRLPPRLELVVCQRGIQDEHPKVIPID